MALRDLSPTSWGAPGTARIDLSIVLSQLGMDPLILDPWFSGQSPSRVDSINISVANNPNFQAVPDAVNSRGVVFIAARNNLMTSSIIPKLLLADTGKKMNPIGFFAQAFDPSDIPLGLYLVAGATVNGNTVIWF